MAKYKYTGVRNIMVKGDVIKTGDIVDLDKKEHKSIGHWFVEVKEKPKTKKSFEEKTPDVRTRKNENRKSSKDQ